MLFNLAYVLVAKGLSGGAAGSIADLSRGDDI